MPGSANDNQRGQKRADCRCALDALFIDKTFDELADQELGKRGAQVVDLTEMPRRRAPLEIDLEVSNGAT